MKPPHKKPELAFKIYRDKQGDYVARIPILNLIADAKTRKEALETLADMEAHAKSFYAEIGKPFPTLAQSQTACDALKRGGKRPGAGRKPVENPMTETLVVNMTRADKTFFENLCKSRKIPIGAWVRAVLLKSAKRSYKRRSPGRDGRARPPAVASAR